MGLGRSAAIATTLVERGWLPKHPAAIIVNASTAGSAGLARNARRSWQAADAEAEEFAVPALSSSATSWHWLLCDAQRSRDRKTRGEICHWHDEEKTFGRARLSFANEAEIDEFVATLEKYERGEITPDQWRAFRLVRGTYGQRQAEDAQMLRIKIPQGVLTADQLDVLAEIGERYSRGFGHITTRQNIQFHFVKLHDVEPAMRLLADAGITTREACGNSVRNITACPYAGVAADERFDVTPYAEALTRYLLRHPLSSTLPRKFKIAFEGCPVDHALTGINDLGFYARRRAGRRPRVSA